MHWQVDESRDDDFVNAVLEILALNDIKAVPHFKGVTLQGMQFADNVTGGKKVCALIFSLIVLSVE